jgi:hypothetical protein
MNNRDWDFLISDFGNPIADIKDWMLPPQERGEKAMNKKTNTPDVEFSTQTPLVDIRQEYDKLYRSHYSPTITRPIQINVQFRDAIIIGIVVIALWVGGLLWNSEKAWRIEEHLAQANWRINETQLVLNQITFNEQTKFLGDAFSKIGYQVRYQEPQVKP